MANVAKIDKSFIFIGLLDANKKNEILQEIYHTQNKFFEICSLKILTTGGTDSENFHYMSHFSISESMGNFFQFFLHAYVHSFRTTALSAS